MPSRVAVVFAGGYKGSPFVKKTQDLKHDCFGEFMAVVSEEIGDVGFATKEYIMCNMELTK